MTPLHRAGPDGLQTFDLQQIHFNGCLAVKERDQYAGLALVGIDFIYHAVEIHKRTLDNAHPIASFDLNLRNRLFRAVWIGPKSVADAVSLLRRNRPELNVELLGPNEFFSLFKEHYSKP
jgi:hypothetical protein